MRVRLTSPKHYLCNETDKLWTLLALKVQNVLTLWPYKTSPIHSLVRTKSRSFLVVRGASAEIRPGTAYKKDDCTSSMPYCRYVTVTIIRTAAL